MPSISVAICCANAAATLEAACRSALWADELVVVDSGSTDATPDIARRYADRYVQEPWRGYGEQKRFAAELCRHDWVLVLDADEEVSEALAAELRELDVSKLGWADVVYMRRRHYLLGRPVRAWWPDWQSRLIHRKRAQWADEAVHDRRVPTHPRRSARLYGWLEHKRLSADGFSDYFCGARLDARLLVVAEEMHRRGKRAHWWDLAARPALSFIKFYLIKRGFLDGSFGLLIAHKKMVSTQLKYAALWAVQHGLASSEVGARPRHEQARRSEAVDGGRTPQPAIGSAPVPSGAAPARSSAATPLRSAPAAS